MNFIQIINSKAQKLLRMGTALTGFGLSTLTPLSKGKKYNILFQKYFFFRQIINYYFLNWTVNLRIYLVFVFVIKYFVLSKMFVFLLKWRWKSYQLTFSYSNQHDFVKINVLKARSSFVYTTQKHKKNYEHQSKTKLIYF